jgi:hypothetical protein
MGTRPQCLVNLMFFSLGDVESPPRPPRGGLSRGLYAQSLLASMTQKSGGRQSTRRPECA